MGALWTDLYELNMAASYIRRRIVLSYVQRLDRHLPPERGYLVAAGLADCLTFLESFCFAADELAYLRDVHAFDEATLQGHQLDDPLASTHPREPARARHHRRSGHSALPLAGGAWQCGD